MAAPTALPAQAPPADFNQQQPNVQAYNQSAEFFLSNYRLGKTLGIGSFGKVKVAEHVLTGHKVAIKILNRRKIREMEMEEKVRREIKILRLFMHPHIIRLYEVIETPTDIYVVMEYVKTGELFDYIVEKGRLLEDEARHFFQQIISGVEYCHRNMVVHRDLKPENLLLDSKYNVKIADFGLSNIMRDGHFLKTSCGSPNYAAPEVISGKLYAGPEVDVWSCGVILYALLCGSLPFDDENIPNLFKKIKGGIYNLPSHLSPGARDLIPRMLLVDPLKRITIPEIRQHPWFTLHLPRYLAVMQAEPVVGVPRIDEEVLEDCVKLGFEREGLTEGLRSRVATKATVTYYLLCDNRRRLPSTGYLSADMAEGSTGAAMAAAGMQYQQQGHFGAPPSTSQPPASTSSSSASVQAQTQGTPQQRLVAERKWRLGVHARGHPSALMAELFRVLQLHQVGWKKMGPYAIKCRRAVKLPPRPPRSPPAGAIHHRMSDDLDLETVAGGVGAGRLLVDHGMTTDNHYGGGVGGSSGSGLYSAAGSGSGMGMLIGPNGSCGGNMAMTPQTPPHPGSLGCRSGPDQDGNFVLKFEAQMYKLRDDEYVIDIQRVDGELFLFMDMCSRLLADLRI